MPSGPLGAPRPAASSSINIRVEMNKPDEDVERALIEGMTQRFSRVESLSITEEVAELDDFMFTKVVIELLLADRDVRLASVEDLVSDIERALGVERIGVTIEAV